MTPLLSICIPTYNRAPYLRSLLESIRHQLGDGVPPGTVEVYVRNNASTDDTAAVLAEQAALLPGLRHSTLAANEGFDRNCFAVVREARGTFCWLMGDDDDLTAGGLQAVLADLAAPDAGDLLLYDRIDCDGGMAPRLRRQWSTAADGMRVRGTSPAELSAYLRSCRNLGALFSFISSLVVRRECWRLPELPDPFDYGYIHVFCCWQILADGGTLTVRHSAPVAARVPEADPNGPAGDSARLFLDLRGYSVLARLAAQKDAVTTAELLRAFRRGRPLSTMLAVAAETAGTARNGELRRLVRACGYGAAVRWLVRHPRIPLALHPLWRRTVTPIRRLLFIRDGTPLPGGEARRP